MRNSSGCCRAPDPQCLPSGSERQGWAKLRVDAHYDNSVNNKFNPNPNRTVYYGQMTWEEMMSPFFGVVVDRGTDVKKLIDSPVAFVSGGA
jgi:hypothetical protein